MIKLKKFAMGLAALAALALGGAAIAGATSGGKDGSSGSDAPDTQVAAPAAKAAGDAAVKAVGGGRVVSVETTDEDSPAVYEVKVADGAKVWEVQVDKSYAVTAQKADDEGTGGDSGDGDGENPND